MAFKNVVLKDLKPNPMRDLRVDPLDTDRVEVLRNSVDVFGFRSGGVVARYQDGEYQIAAGHTRVAGAIKGGVKEAVIEVVPMTDTDMARWYVQENVSQRGQSPTAGPGAIIAAVRILAPLIMRGDLKAFNAAKPERCVDIDTPEFSQLVSAIADPDKGIGRRLLLWFFTGVEGLHAKPVQDFLEITKATGAYQRTIREIADVIEAEDAANERERQKQAKAEEEARTKATKAKEASGSKPKTTKGTKPKTAKGTKPKTDRTATSTARGAREATKAKAPTLNEKVAALFENKNQVKTFFEVVKTIGFGLFFRGKRNAKRNEDNAKDEARKRSVKLQFEKAIHNIFRDIQRMVAQGTKLKDLIKDHPDVPINITPGQIRDLERGLNFLNAMMTAANKQSGSRVVVPFPQIANR